MRVIGLFLIIGVLAARDEWLISRQKREHRRLTDAWENAHGELPPMLTPPAEKRSAEYRLRRPLPRRALSLRQIEK